jgi:hypothetical protein
MSKFFENIKSFFSGKFAGKPQKEVPESQLEKPKPEKGAGEQKQSPPPLAG